MTVDALRQGDLRLLDHPVAQKLLASAIPARLGYVARDGTPRVSPMWFGWNGTELVFGATGDSPKVAALREHAAVAVTIDTESAPYEILLVRGNAEVEIVEGVVEEYAAAAVRYLGETAGEAYRRHAYDTMNGMARITVRPQWVGVIDFQTRYPSTY